MLEPHYVVGAVTTLLGVLLLVSGQKDAVWLAELRLSRWAYGLAGAVGRKAVWTIIGIILLAASVWIFWHGPFPIA
ncbi:MAG: hypothetical protein R3B96_25320 [Pirellulaceae bacterium]